MMLFIILNNQVQGFPFLDQAKITAGTLFDTTKAGF